MPLWYLPTSVCYVRWLWIEYGASSEAWACFELEWRRIWLCVLTVCSGKFEYGRDPSGLPNSNRERGLIHGLRKVSIKIEPEFHSGGKYEKWYGFWSGRYYFFYRPSSVPENGSHVRDGGWYEAHVWFLVWMCTHVPAMFFLVYLQIGLCGEYRYRCNGVLRQRTLASNAVIGGFDHYDESRYGHTWFTVQMYFFACLSCYVCCLVFLEVLFFFLCESMKWKRRRFFCYFHLFAIGL